MNNNHYLLLKLYEDDVLKKFDLFDDLNELVMLIKDELMVYYNDQDKEVYEEINHLEDEDEVQYIP